MTDCNKVFYSYYQLTVHDSLIVLLTQQKRIREIAPKIVQLLTEWTETFPYDFRDERMMRSLKEMTHRLAFGDEVSRCDVTLII